MHQLELDLIGGENSKKGVATTIQKKTDTESPLEDDTNDIPIQLELDLSLS